MSTIQRTLIRDQGGRIVIRNNHRLGMVFVAFAAIPMLVPFRADESDYGTALTTLGALVFLAIGLGVLAWRNVIELDLDAGTCTLVQGFWPHPRRTTGPLSRVTTVRIDECHAPLSGRTTHEIAFALGGDEAFTFFETSERDEALEVQQHWLGRLRAGCAPAAGLSSAA